MNKGEASRLASVAAGVYFKQSIPLEKLLNRFREDIQPVYEAYRQVSTEVFADLDLISEGSGYRVWADECGSEPLSELLRTYETYEPGLSTLENELLADTAGMLDDETLDTDKEAFFYRLQPNFEDLFLHHHKQRPLPLGLQFKRWLIKVLGRTTLEDRISQKLSQTDFMACCRRYAALTAAQHLIGYHRFRAWQSRLNQDVLLQSHHLLWLRPSGLGYDLALAELNPVLKALINQQAIGFKRDLRGMLEYLLKREGFNEGQVLGVLESFKRLPDVQVTKTLKSPLADGEYFNHVWAFLRKESQADFKTLARFHALAHQINYLNLISLSLVQQFRDRSERRQKMMKMAKLWGRKPWAAMQDKTKWLVDVPEMKAKELEKQLPLCKNLFYAIASFSDYDSYARALASGQRFLAFDIFASQSQDLVSNENFNRVIIEDIAVYRKARSQKKADFNEIAAWLNWRDSVAIEDIFVYEEELLLEEEETEAAYAEDEYGEAAYAETQITESEYADTENLASELDSEVAAAEWEANDMGESVGEAVSALIESEEQGLDAGDDQS